jgi:(p)ppGpp synthase/HD superfamily hydrolase
MCAIKLFRKGYIALRNRERFPLTLQALEFADRWHKGQTRRDGRDYIHHPIEVATLLCYWSCSGVATDKRLAIALLHDVVEEAKSNREQALSEMRKQFDADIIRVVLILTDGKLDDILDDEDAAIIKISDRARNIGDYVISGTLKGLGAYVKRTEDMYVPMFYTAAEKYPEYSGYFWGLITQLEANLRALKHYIREARVNTNGFWDECVGD